jgi:hypothetical protein
VLADSSTLPSQPNQDRLNALCGEIVADVLRRTS